MYMRIESSFSPRAVHPRSSGSTGVILSGPKGQDRARDSHVTKSREGAVKSHPPLARDTRGPPRPMLPGLGVVRAPMTRSFILQIQ